MPKMMHNTMQSSSPSICTASNSGSSVISVPSAAVSRRRATSTTPFSPFSPFQWGVFFVVALVAIFMNGCSNDIIPLVAAQVLPPHRMSNTSTPTRTFSKSDTQALTATESLMPTVTMTTSPTNEQTMTVTGTGTDTVTASETGQSFTPDFTASGSESLTLSDSETKTETLAITDSVSQTFSDSALTQSQVQTLTLTASEGTLSMSDPTPTQTFRITGSLSVSVTMTRSLTPTLTMSETVSTSLSSDHTASFFSSTHTATIGETATNSLVDTFTKTETQSETMSEPLSSTPSTTITRSESVEVTNTGLTPSETLTETLSTSETGSFTESGSESIAVSATPSVIPTTTVSASSTETMVMSDSETLSLSVSESATVLPTPSASETFSGETNSASFADTITGSETTTGSMSLRPSTSASGTQTLSTVLTVTHSHGTETNTFSESTTMTPSSSFVPTLTASLTPSQSKPTTETEELTFTGSISETISVSDSPTMSASGGTVSGSDTGDVTSTLSLSETFSTSETLTFAQTDSTSETISESPSVSHIITVSETPSVTETGSESYTGSFAPSGTNSDSITIAVTESPTFTASDAPSDSAEVSLSTSQNTATLSASPSWSASDTLLATTSPSSSASESLAVSLSLSHPLTLSTSDTVLPTTTNSLQQTVTDTLNPTFTPSETLSGSDGTESISTTVAASETHELSGSISGTTSFPITGTDSQSATFTLSESFSHVVTLSSSESRSITLSMSPSLVETLSDTVVATPSMTTSFSRSTSPSNTYTFSGLSESGSVTMMESPSSSESVSTSMSETTTNSASETHTGVLSSSETVTDTPSGTPSIGETTSQSVANTVSWPASMSMSFPSQSFSDSASTTISPTITASLSEPSHTVSDVVTQTEPTTSETSSPSETLTLSESRSNTGASVTLSGTDVVSPTQGSSSLSVTVSPTSTAAVSDSVTISASLTTTATLSHVVSGTVTLSESVSTSQSVTESASPTVTETVSGESESHTYSAHPSASEIITGSASVSVSMTQTGTATLVATPSLTVSESVSYGSGSVTIHASVSDTITASEAVSVSSSVSVSDSARTWSTTPSHVVTETVSPTGPTPEVTLSSLETLTVSGSEGTETITGSPTVTGTTTHSLSPSQIITESRSNTYTASMLASSTLTMIPTSSETTSTTLSADPTATVGTETMTDTASETMHDTVTLSDIPSETGSESVSHTITNSESINDYTASAPISSTESFSASDSGTVTILPTPTSTYVDTSTPTTSPTVPATKTATDIGTETIVATNTASFDVTTSVSRASLSLSPSLSLIDTDTATESESPSTTPSLTDTESLSLQETFTNTESNTKSVVVTPSEVITLSDTSSASFTTTISKSDTTTVSESDSESSSFTDSAAVTRTAQESESPSVTFSSSHSPQPTKTPTKSVTKEPTKTASLASTETLSLTASMVDSDTATMSESTTATQTMTESMSDGTRTFAESTTSTISASGESPTLANSPTTTVSFSVSSSRELPPSVSISTTTVMSDSASTTLAITDSETPSGSSTKPASTTVTVSETLTDGSMSKTLVASSSGTLTETVTDTLSASSSRSKSVESVKSGEATFSTLPAPFNTDQFFVSRHLTIELKNMPLDKDKDLAGLTPQGEECYSAGDKNARNPNQVPLIFRGRLQANGAFTNNWTVTVENTGSYYLCFYNARESTWYAIVSSSLHNFTYVPYVQPWTTVVSPNVVGGTVFFRSTVKGADWEKDALIVTPFGHSCQAPTTFFRFPLGNLDGDNVLYANSSSLFSRSALYTLCYRGYPFSGPYFTISSGPVAIVGQATGMTILSGKPYRIFRPITMKVSGSGLGVLDSFFATSHADCQEWHSSGDRVVTRGVIAPVTDRRPQGRVDLTVTFSIGSSGTVRFCYRSNTSNTYQSFTTLDVAPIQANGFEPRNVNWAKHGDVQLTLFGDGVDNKYDQVELHPIVNEISCNSGSSSVVKMKADAGATNRFIGRVHFAGDLALCFKSNHTNFNVVGNVTVAKRFYNFSTTIPSELNDPFYSGVALEKEYHIVPTTHGLNPAGDSVYVMKYNASASPCQALRPSVHPDGVTPVPVPTSRYPNGTVAFTASERGYWVVCWVMSTGAVLTSAQFAIFSEPPSSFTPSIVRFDQSTAVTFEGGAGMDITDGDSIFMCDSSFNASVSIATTGARTATFKINRFGGYKVCFTSGVVSQANPTPLITTIPGDLNVAPYVESATYAPATILAGGSVKISLTGAGLTMQDILFICDLENLNGPAPDVANQTHVTFRQLNLTYWIVDFSKSGSFELCYKHAPAVSFPPGPIGVKVVVDAPVDTFFPTSIAAAKLQFLNFTSAPGVDQQAVKRIFVRTNTSSCADRPSPFDVDMTKIANDYYSVTLDTRGTFPVCFEGESGNVYGIGGNHLQVIPSVANFSVRQSGVAVSEQWETQTFFDYYPMEVIIVGGAMRYSEDKFYAVQGANCGVLNPPNLTSLNAPVGDANVLTLTLVLPSAGDWKICYKLQGALDGTLIPDHTIKVTSSLTLNNQTLGIQGPSIDPDVLYSFSFTILAEDGVTDGAEVFTPFQESTASSAVDLAYIPIGKLVFKCTLLDQGGNPVRMLQLNHDQVGSLELCSTFPQTLRNLDKVKQFASSVIALHNHNALKCVDATSGQVGIPTTAALSGELMALVKQDQSLVVDPTLTFDSVSDAVNAAPVGQPVAGTFEEAETMLEMGNEVLNRPGTQLDEKTIEAHIKLTSAVVQVAVTKGPEDPVNGQKLGTKSIERLGSVAKSFCSSPIADSVRSVNVSAGDISVTILKESIDESNRSPLMSSGFGMSTSPTFVPTIRGSKCLQAVGSRQNFLHQVTGAARRQERASFHQLEDTTAPTPVPSDASSSSSSSSQADLLPEFNLPLFTFSLPADSASNPMTQTEVITFRTLYPPVTPPSGSPDLGVKVKATIYRFVPISADQGWWQPDDNVAVSADNIDNILTVEYNTSVAFKKNSLVAQPNFVLLSGVYEVTPIVDERETDYWMMTYILCLPILHIVLVLLTRYRDRKLDELHDPDTEAVPLFNMFTLHRWVFAGTRKAHHPIRTPRRITVLFSFWFAVSLFSAVVVDEAPWDHEFYMNIPYALGVISFATPFAAIVRIGLYVNLRDYATGIASAVTIVSIAIVLPLVNVFVAMLIVAPLGIVTFLAASLIFRTRSTLRLQAEQDKFPFLFSLLCHIGIEIGAFVFIMYTALAKGTPIQANKAGDYHYFQIIAWALLMDALLIEPLKNVLILAFHAGAVKVDKKLDEKKTELRRKKLEEARARRAELGSMQKADTTTGDDDDLGGSGAGLPTKFYDSASKQVDIIDGLSPPTGGGGGGAQYLYYDSDLEEIEDDDENAFDDLSVVEVAPTPQSGRGVSEGSAATPQIVATNLVSSLQNPESSLDELDTASNTESNYSLEDPWESAASVTPATSSNFESAAGTSREGSSVFYDDENRDVVVREMSHREPTHHPAHQRHVDPTAPGSDPYDGARVDLDRMASDGRVAASVTSRAPTAAANPNPMDRLA